MPAERAVTLKDLLTHTSGLQQIDIPNDALPATTPTTAGTAQLRSTLVSTGLLARCA